MAEGQRLVPFRKKTDSDHLKVSMKKILIVNVNWVGDVLFSTPAIRAIRKKYPDSFISCLLPRRCEALLKNNPYLNELILIDDRRSLFSYAKALKIFFKIRSRHFDAAIFFHRSRTRIFFIKMAGVPVRLGYAKQPEKRFLTHVFPLPQHPLHKTDYFLNLLTAMGIAPDGRTPDFFPQKAARNPLAGERYVALHPGGNWLLKRWPAENFAQWIDGLSEKFPDTKIILCGTFAEKPLSDQIKSLCSSPRLVVMTGKTSLDELALLLKEARLLLSNDSGPIHLAASQKTPILGIFGPTHPDLTGPLSLGPVRILKKETGCQVPCYFRDCNYRVCMEWITPDEALQAASELLRA